MESVDLTLAEEALRAIAKKAIERKTGARLARGLRSIMESILLDTMFDLPSLEGVEEAVISREVVEASARPLYIYADRSPEDRGADQIGVESVLKVPHVIDVFGQHCRTHDLPACSRGRSRKGPKHLACVFRGNRKSVSINIRSPSHPGNLGLDRL
jgi:hypothetical protein